ncbi:MAG: AAA-like domain-containing protein, partial [Lachnospiraceae bacterium]|nr:AAA-like domain-containing protein [Lachnospiraceae bacterium]
RDYIEQGAYFTINRARQFGKTTLLSALARRLVDSYLVIRLSFEGIDDDNFSDNMSFVNMFIKNVAKRLRQINARQELIDEWIADDFTVKDKAFDVLGDKITRLCSRAQKGVILLVDEVDKSSDNQIFLNFLGLLRNKYLDMQEGLDISFQSVILAGVYDIKNLKLKLRSEEARRYNSPWNIAVDFDVDMSFSVDEITKMLKQYSADKGMNMNTQAVSEKIRFYTNGYPFLVSWICKWIDERGGRQWTVQNVENAEKELLNNDNTLFDDIIKNIENNKELKQIITEVLFEGKKLLYAKSYPAINLGIMFGILAEREKTVCISNIVFETYLYNHILVGKMREQHTF